MTKFEKVDWRVKCTCERVATFLNSGLRSLNSGRQSAPLHRQLSHKLLFTINWSKMCSGGWKERPLMQLGWFNGGWERRPRSFWGKDAEDGGAVHDATAGRLKCCRRAFKKREGAVETLFGSNSKQHQQVDGLSLQLQSYLWILWILQNLSAYSVGLLYKPMLLT